MTDVPRPTASGTEPRPDLRLCLLEAIHQRDASQTRRLAERWVHRRGLVSLEAFQRITLQTIEGPEGCRWLQELLGVEPPPSVGEAVATALTSEFSRQDRNLPATAPPLAPLAAVPEARAANEPLSSMEKAFAALAAEFPSGEPPAPVESLPLEPVLLEPLPEERAPEERAPEERAPEERAPEEPLAPLPTFHPTASILAALAQPEPATDSRRPRSPRWLPHLRLPGPSRGPAPAPAGLADLRAWLPDAEDELPRAS